MGTAPDLFLEVRVKRLQNGFYQAKAWERCREAYRKSVGGLCERCKAKGIIQAGRVVHHKIYLTPENCTNPEIAYGFGNLELLCQACHAEEHIRNKRRYIVDDNGFVTIAE